MPLYEYRCNACEHTLEALQKFSDDPLKECPECHKPNLERLVSKTAFQLKGDGWYVTDFKNNGKAPATESKKSEGSSSASE